MQIHSLRTADVFPVVPPPQTSRNTFFIRTFFIERKNVEAEINQNFKNVLKTFLRLRVDLERIYFAGLYLKWHA